MLCYAMLCRSCHVMIRSVRLCCVVLGWFGLGWVGLSWVGLGWVGLCGVVLG